MARDAGGYLAMLEMDRLKPVHARFAGRAPRARKAATRRRTPKASPSECPKSAHRLKPVPLLKG